MAEDTSSNIAKLLAAKRANMTRSAPSLGPFSNKLTISRLTGKEAYEAAQTGNGTTLIDTRPAIFREQEGAIPGAIVMERSVCSSEAVTLAKDVCRNVLEWRLDPTSPDAIPEAKDPNFRPVLFCNNAYSSTLAVDSLHQLGVKNAIDLDGGYRKWKEDGLPVDESQIKKS
ncbi:Hypothetical predicted protein [Olea europaea subsp. europaea]|uniref:Rhodanese domain-containing protein n=1 Tax=Olea europaea subsp. europaea TaxID=158383 RepID=A0A8S0SEH0_OLEEU|nr:Hypothetical predicted protein [Olea europaea subsp. europaea]